LKILVIPGGSPATVFALVPLATAARNAGHEVFVAAIDDMVPAVTGAGLPAVSVTPHSIQHFIFTERDGSPSVVPQQPEEQELHTGRWFARMAVASLPALTDLARDWRPDVVVGGTMSYAAPLLAAHLGVPFVRQTWDTTDARRIHLGAVRELRPELTELGLDDLPEPDLLIDICPPSLRPAGLDGARPMRWIPGNAQRRLEPWMYRRPERHRICVTAGSRVMPGNTDFLRGLLHGASALDAEVVVAAPEELAAPLRAEFPGLRAGWLPLDVLAPTCDLIVHHAGGVTGLTAMNAGVPQLLIPRGANFVAPSRRVAAFGAAVTLLPGEDTAQAVPEACQEILSNPSYRKRAAELSAEIAELPLPADVLGHLETLISV
jgi:glycosyltransferase